MVYSFLKQVFTNGNSLNHLIYGFVILQKNTKIDNKSDCILIGYNHYY